MTLALGIILSSIFLILSLLHFYWSLGGKSGFSKSLPETKEGRKVIHPKKTDSFIVATGLLAMSAFVLIRIAILPVSVPPWLMKYGLWVISVIFILRSIGDFRYAGFFKQIKHSAFAKSDSRYYSPLCLLIGIIGIVIELVKPNA